jgi:hypothetical protein
VNEEKKPAEYKPNIRRIMLKAHLVAISIVLATYLIIYLILKI